MPDYRSRWLDRALYELMDALGRRAVLQPRPTKPPQAWSESRKVTVMGNSVNHFEIGTPDPEITQDFYGGVFGWAMDEQLNRYRTIQTGTGRMCDTSTIGGESWAIFYVQVDDVRAVIEKAVDLGAPVVVPLTDNGAIEFAHLCDPHGNRFGVWRPKHSN